MTVLLTRESHHVRRSRQQRIERLLDELDRRRTELYRLKAAGVQRAGMSDAKEELSAVRGDLREAVADTGTDGSPTTFMRMEGHAQ